MENKTILIVDDDESICETLCDILEESGYSTQSSQTGQAALAMLENSFFDVALLDIQLPDIDGVELLKKAKSLHPAMACALITGNASIKIAVDALREGAFGYFVKPLVIDEVLHDLKDALEKRTLEVKLEEAQAHIFKQEKMAVIGQLAAGVAHEVNNPVGFVNSNLSTLGKYLARLEEFIVVQSETLEALGDSEKKEALLQKRKQLKVDYILEDSKDLVEESLEGTDRIKKIVQDLKLFSRSDSSSLVITDINDAVESALNIVWNELKYTCTVNKELGQLPETYSTPQKLSQVFMNIFVNAGHSIEQDGIISISSKEENGLITVSISDNGCGMSQEVQDRIFEPFFTTKEAGKGTGLGMSIAAEIIQKLGGDIAVKSQVGEGTTFTVTLPVKETAEPSAEE